MEGKAVSGMISALLICSLVLSFTVFPEGVGLGFGTPYNDAILAPDLPRGLSESLLSSPSPGYYETSEYLIGSVAVGVVFLESNGTIDPSTEDWTSTEESWVVSEIQVALNWLAGQNPNAGVSFTFDVHFAVPTRYEPINHKSYPEENLWITEAMTFLGYAGTDYFAQVRDYINDLRDKLGTDWAYAMFIVDSSKDPDGKFKDGLFAYAYLGGPFLVMTYDNDGYGIGNMDFVCAHETCHTFYATDEYDGVTETSGYLGVQDVEGSGDMMCALSWWLCANSREQLGWRDSDGDGLQDIVDTFPDTVLNPYSPDPTNKPTLTYSGSVTEIPYPNNNPFGTGRDVTINTIANVEFRVDNGAWQSATPDDGAFYEAEENFSFTTPSLSVGTHMIETRGINSVGNVETTYARDDVTRVWALVYVPDDYSKIQSAVNAAYSGDTVFVRAETFYENIVVNKTVLLVGQSGETTIIDGGGMGSVIKVTVDNVTIRGFIIRNSGKELSDSGIALSNVKDCKISGNIITANNGSGIYLDSSKSNIITENNITNNKYGMGLYFSSNYNSISGNNITANSGDAIWLYSSSNNSILGNKITNNGRGVGLGGSSNNNSIVGNKITNNEIGISLSDSSNDSIYHNNFINNAIQVVSNSVNVWDNGYPSGGNYWSDYTGTDFYSGPYQNETGSDGIGDTLYVIDADNRDRYPLMNPSAPVHDVAITKVALSKTVVGQGCCISVNVSVANQGYYTETLDVTLYANATSIASQTVTLSGGTSTTITFTWNSTGFAKGNYTISAYASPVLGETDKTDNTLVDGWVIIAIMGDVNGDRIVDVFDLIKIGVAFGSKPGDANWNPNADLREDNLIDVFDLIRVAIHFGEVSP